MPISATACRTSSNLNGLMTAVISFMHLSLLSLVSNDASGTASAYYSVSAVQLPCQPGGALNQWVGRLTGGVTHRHGANPWVGRVTGVQGTRKFGRSYELYQFEPTG